MYTAFYQLNEKPFRISSDPSFMWLGEKHREALATLRYGILDNKGFMLLTGDVGTGKTTLINALIESLSDDVYYASVPDPRLSLGDFLNYISQAFHIDQEFKSKGPFLLHFGWFLEAAYKQNKKVLLIIDEAQLLTQALLEEIRLLSNINRDGNHLLNILLVGQNEFNDILARSENRAVTQRLTLNYNIKPLAPHETEHYITHRLKVAGRSALLFSAAAVKKIHAYSGGIPRRINVVCDHCLLTGYVEEKERIDDKIVTASTKDIELPCYVEPARQIQQDDGPPATKSAQSPSASDTARRPGIIGVSLLMASGLSVVLCVIAFIIFFLAKPGTFEDFYQNVGIVSQERAPHRPVQPQDTATPHSPHEQNPPPPSPFILPKSDVAQASALPAPEATVPSGRQSGAGDDRKAPMPGDGAAAERPVPAPASGRDGSRHTKAPTAVDESESASNGGITPTQLLVPLPEETIIIGFDSDSNDFFTPDLDEQLAGLVRSIKAHPDAVLNISGYTDSIGSEVYNSRLSLFRANVIKSYLLGKGALARQITVSGLGSQKPIGDNSTPEGRKLNRRVEINVIKP